MDFSESNVKRIANALVDATVKYLDAEPEDARMIFRGMSKFELLVYNQVHNGNMEDMAYDLRFEDTVDRDMNGHIARLIMSDHNPDILKRLDKLPELTELVIPAPPQEQLTEFLEDMRRAPQLETVYFYYKSRDPRNRAKARLSGLDNKYNTSEYTNPPYSDESIEYYLIKRI